MLFFVSLLVCLRFLVSKTQFLSLDSINIGCTEFEYQNGTWNYSYIPHIIQEAIYQTEVFIGEIETLYDLPSVSFGIVYNQHLIHYHGSGRANISNATSTPNHNTIYRIGSITKVFTVLIAYILRDKGFIHMDAPLHDYNSDFSIRNPWGLGEYERSGHTITVQQLAAEVSGLPSEAPCTNGSFESICNTTTAEILDILSSFYTIHPTDTQASYSNLGYALLGNILTEYASLDFPTALNSFIVSPLALQNTGLYLTSTQQQHAAVGYDYQRQAQYWIDLGWAAPAGQMFSSVHDLSHVMAQFFEAVPALYATSYNTDPTFTYITGPQTLREMLRPVIINPDKQSAVGAPWEIQEVLNFWPRTKTGAIDGFSSSIALVPELRLGVIGLTNTDIDASVLTLGPLEILTPAFQAWLSVVQADYRPALPKYAENAVGDYYFDNYFAFAIELTYLNDHQWLMIYDLRDGQYGTLISYNSTNGNNDHGMFYKSLEWNTQSCWQYVLNAIDGITFLFNVDDATNEVLGATLPDTDYGNQINRHDHTGSKYFRREKTDIKKRVLNRMPNQKSVLRLRK